MGGSVRFLDMQPAQSPPYAGPAFGSSATDDARRLVEISRLLVLVLSLVAVALGALGILAVHAIGLLSGVYLLIGFVIGIITYLKLGDILQMFTSGDLRRASSELLLWGIISLIFVLVIPGVLLLVAWIRLEDSLRAPPVPYASAAPPYGYGAPPAPEAGAPASPGYGTSPPVAPPPPPPLPAQPVPPPCPRCGRAATYLPQYGRYYCYTCQQYV
jgi:hypothetical protein